jgi:hypothetical protein
MRQHRFVTALVVVSLATVLFVPSAGPAGAAVANGCTTGMYPNDPAGPSQLKVACTFTTATAVATGALRIEDFPEAQWSAAAARFTHADGHVTAGSTAVSSATGHFTATDVNRAISGTGIKPRTFIKAVPSATTATLSQVALTSSTTAVLTTNYSYTRSVLDAVTTAGSKVVTSSTANFKSADVGDPILGTNLPHGATITTITNVTTVAISANATASGTAQGLVVSDPHTGGASFQVHDMHTTNGSKTVTSAMASSYLADGRNIGLRVAGSDQGNADFAGDPVPGVDVSLEQIPGGISAPATRTTTGAVLTFGDRSPFAPPNGSPVAHLNMEQALNPALVKGAPACSNNVVSGSRLIGTWQNPGSFVGGAGVASSEAAGVNGPILAQIAFATPVISFVGYVVQEKASTAGESQTVAHDDIYFPSFPFLSTGTCGGPSTVGASMALQFGDGTPSPSDPPQRPIPPPGVRALNDFAVGTGTRTTSAYVHVLGGSGSPLFAVATPCTETYPGTPDFACGNG